MARIGADCYPRGSVAQLLIEGGTRLVGRVPISGSKNAVLPILAACLLTEEEVRLKNVPRIEDAATMVRLLEGMGVQIRWLDPQQLQINAERLASRSKIGCTVSGCGATASCSRSTRRPGPRSE